MTFDVAGLKRDTEALRTDMEARRARRLDDGDGPHWSDRAPEARSSSRTSNAYVPPEALEALARESGQALRSVERRLESRLAEVEADNLKLLEHVAKMAESFDATLNVQRTLDKIVALLDAGTPEVQPKPPRLKLIT